MKKLFFFFLFLFFAFTAFSQTYKSGESVMISWKGNWYYGKIIKADGEKYLVSYDGYDASWNETVGTDRLKKEDSENSQTTSQSQNTPEVNHGGDAYFSGVQTIWDIDQSGDGKFIFAASAYGNIEILNEKDLSLVSEIAVSKNPLDAISVTSDGNFIAVGGDNTFVIYSKDQNGNYVQYFSSDYYSSISKLSFSPVSHDLVIGGSPKEDYIKTQVDIWNTDEKKLKSNLVKSTNGDYAISGLSVSADGKKIAVGISNNKRGIDVFDATTGKLSFHIPCKHDVSALAFSPDGNSIISGGTDKKVTLWNLSTKTATWSSIWKTGETDYVQGVAFSPDGQTVCACGSGTGCTVEIYDSSTGKTKLQLSDLNPGGNDVLFGKDGVTVFVGLTTYGDIAKVSILEKYVIEH